MLYLDNACGGEFAVKEKKKRNISIKLRSIVKYWQLYVFMLPAVLYTALFAYKPMHGILIAFQDFSIRRGVWGSDWVGFENFERLFTSYWFPVILRNTLTLSMLSLLLGFPIPILLALLFNEVKSAKFRGLVQTTSYAPHFISTVVMCGIIALFLDPSNGIVNIAITAFGGESIYFLQEPGMFKWIYVLSGIWQGMGWSSIIYYAALSGVDNALLEAAEMDGATRIQKIWHINLPTIRPTIVIMLVLACGSILGTGYEKAYLLQTDVTLSASEIISTYVYKVGIEQTDYSFSTAVSLFNSVVNGIMLIVANFISKKITDSGLF